MTALSDATSLTAETITIEEKSPLQIIMSRFVRHRMAMIAMFLMIFIFGISIFAAQVAQFHVDELKVGKYFVPFGTIDEKTGRTHILGTDHIGRDYFSRLVYAGRISLSVALLSVFISQAIGITVGAIAGYYGGKVDTLLMRFVEFLLTLPTLPLLLIVSSMLLRNEEFINIPEPILTVVGKIMLLSPRNAKQALLIVAVLAGLGWLTPAQLMRGMVLSLRGQTFVEAAKALGASHTRIIFSHMIPNSLAPLIVDASLAMAGYVVAEAALSFLGFGIQDPIPTWGNMLAATQQYMFDRPWLPLIPGLPIFLCSLSFNYIGDGLRDAIDPRLKM